MTNLLDAIRRMTGAQRIAELEAQLQAAQADAALWQKRAEAAQADARFYYSLFLNEKASKVKP